MKNNYLPLIIGAAIFMVIIVAGVIVYLNSQQPADLSHICPDSWYENRMPMVGRDGDMITEDENQQYNISFMVNDKKIDTRTVDLDWVSSNCEIKRPEIAQ